MDINYKITWKAENEHKYLRRIDCSENIGTNYLTRTSNIGHTIDYISKNNTGHTTDYISSNTECSPVYLAEIILNAQKMLRFLLKHRKHI